MIEQPERLVLAIAGAAKVWGRADPAEIAATEPDPIDIPGGQHSDQ
jgi:hypothetical protein